MAERGGVRIQHPVERNCTFTLVDQSRAYQEPHECGTCHLVHTFKTYHFKLDAVGATIVSHEIVERLRRLPASGGFTIGEHILQPPAQRLLFGTQHDAPRVIAHPELVEPR